MGGGTLIIIAQLPDDPGLSPRGRGNRVGQFRADRVQGSIPAWAGEPWSYRHLAPPTAVYPRVGGGTEFSPSSLSSHRGLSPRGRGNPARGALAFSWTGSIPAWAGEPAAPAPGPQHSGVYPRVGGGTRRGCKSDFIDEGLSPRGRGNPLSEQRSAGLERSIPAWAGEPLHVALTRPHHAVYPRVGGGTNDRRRGGNG